MKLICTLCSKKRHSKEHCYFHYTKSLDVFLSKVYKNMRQRVTGIQKNKSHIYLGLELVNKEEFLKWSEADDSFLKLYDEWVRNNYDRTLTPSIDRIDSKQGYTLNNMRWIPNWLNCSYGAKSDKRYEK